MTKIRKIYVIIIAMFLFNVVNANENIFTKTNKDQKIIVIKDSTDIFDEYKKNTITKVNMNDKLIFLEKEKNISTFKGITNYWWKIKLPNNKIGWVFGEFVAPYYNKIGSHTFAIGESFIEASVYSGKKVNLMYAKLLVLENKSIVFLYSNRINQNLKENFNVMVKEIQSVAVDDFDKNGVKEIVITCDLSSRANEIAVDGIHTYNAINAKLCFNIQNNTIINTFNFFSDEEDASRAGIYKRTYTYTNKKNLIIEKIMQTTTLYNMDGYKGIPTEDNYEKSYSYKNNSYYSNNLPFQSSSMYVTPTVKVLRFRDGANLDSKIIGKLISGEKLTLISTKGEIEKINGVEGSWVAVETSNGVIGWCFDAYLEKYKGTYK